MTLTLTQTRHLEEAFRSVLGTKVSLTRGRRGGKLVIHFYSDEELQTIYEQIVGANKHLLSAQHAFISHAPGNLLFVQVLH